MFALLKDFLMKRIGLLLMISLNLTVGAQEVNHTLNKDEIMYSPEKRCTPMENGANDGSTMCVEGENYKVIKRFKNLGLNVECVQLERAEYKWIVVEADGNVISFPSKIREKSLIHCPE